MKYGMINREHTTPKENYWQIQPSSKMWSFYIDGKMVLNFNGSEKSGTLCLWLYRNPNQIDGLSSSKITVDICDGYTWQTITP